MRHLNIKTCIFFVGFINDFAPIIFVVSALFTLSGCAFFRERKPLAIAQDFADNARYVRIGPVADAIFPFLVSNEEGTHFRRYDAASGFYDFDKDGLALDQIFAHRDGTLTISLRRKNAPSISLRLNAKIDPAPDYHPGESHFSSHNSPSGNPTVRIETIHGRPDLLVWYSSENQEVQPVLYQCLYVSKFAR
jgi:hypothetical protein